MNIIRFNTNDSEKALQDLINRFERVRKIEDLKNVVSESQNRYGLKNLAYLGYNLGEISKSEPFSIVTYNQQWINCYREKNYFEVDPVLKNVRRSILPLDWADIEISSKEVQHFFKEAIEAGVGQHGLSIPVQGRNGDYSVLSITVDESSEDWDHFKNTYMRDLQILALYFHKSVLEVNNVSPPDFNLTNRELDILYWSACGKSSEDTGAIIGISKSTVRFHVSNILTKLNAVNITHAVGKAIFYGLIGRPS